MENVEQRVARAMQLRAQGCGCCQAVVLTFTDLLPIDSQSAANLAQPFARGMSGTKQTCGCVAGMAIVCGLLGQTMMFKGLANQFAQEQGELGCPQLLAHQGAGHSCDDLVAAAVRQLAEIL